MAGRIARSAQWVNLAGAVALLVGLGWDAALHRVDPALAEREGVFTLTNPGHVLFAAGVGLVVAGTLLFLCGRLAGRPASSWRRRLALGAPAAGLVALAGVSLAFAGASPGGLTGHTHSHVDTAAHAHADIPIAAPDAGVIRSDKGVVHAHGAEVAVTAAQLTAAMQLWSDTRAGVARLQDFSVAQAEGYRQITPWVGRLAHFHNQRYFAAGHTLDPEHPEELIYARMPGKAQPRLVGVMYLAQPGAAGPKIGGALTSWHAHDNLCYTPDGAMVVALANAAGQCPAGTVYKGITPEMLHVWVVDNPAGIFSEDMSPAALVSLLSGQ